MITPTQGNLSKIQKIMDILEEFRNNYSKRLNFSKIAKLLDLSPAEGEKIISILLQSQDLFTHIFQNHQLNKFVENNQVYLTTTPTYLKRYHVLTSTQIGLMNDIVYTFKNVKRGQGFAVEANSSILLKKIKKLQIQHPYLFDKRGNGLIYPSKIGLRLGEFILSCTRNNKEIKKIPIDNYIFMVDEDERF
jgi:hypothetical protein